MNISIAIIALLAIVVTFLGAQFMFWPWRAARATRLLLDSRAESATSTPAYLQLPDASARETYLWSLLHQDKQPVSLGCALYLLAIVVLFNYVRFPPSSFLRLIADAIVAIICWVPALAWVAARKEKAHERVLAVLRTSTTEEAEAILRRFDKQMEEQRAQRAKQDAELEIARQEAEALSAEYGKIFLPLGHNLEGPLHRRLQWPNRCAGCGDVLPVAHGYVQVICSDYLGGGLSTTYKVQLPICRRLRCRIGKGEIIDANGSLLFKERDDAFRPTGAKDSISGVHKVYVEAFRELNNG